MINSDHTPNIDLPVEMSASVSGEYQLHITHLDGSVTSTDWFDNMILNQGLNKLGRVDPVLYYCHIGTGTTAPAVTQTALVAFTASSAYSPYADSMSNETAAPWRSTITYKYLFAQSAVIGNMSEIGVSGTDVTGDLFSRARILDSGGTATTITLTALDQLTVYYRVRFTPTTTTLSSSVTISSVAYPYQCKVAQVASFASSTSILQTGSNFSDLSYAGTWGADMALGAIIDQPTGTVTGVASTITPSAYTEGTYRKDTVVVYNIDAGNDGTNGIKGFSLYFGAFSMIYQLIFTGASIPKTNTKTLSITFRFTWSRTP